ncbi:hypothetical protein ASD11_15065 [Aeromicrobium sp. Root495]|nr:hypothetical protein ASD11_15065 [Aeromicrobium sp. Root495]
MATAAVMVLTGCTHAPPDERASRPQPAVEKYAETLSTVRLDVGAHTAPPQGFERADVLAFKRQILELMRRSLSSRTANLSLDAAYDYVTESLYAATLDNVDDGLPDVFGNDWKASLATTLGQRPVRPARLVTADWTTTSKPAELDDGTPSRTLTVRLDVHAVVTTGTDARPNTIILRRHILLRGFRPRGGPDWWPVLGFGTQNWGVNECESQAVDALVPETDASELRKQLVKARNSVNGLGPSQEPNTTLEDYRAFLASCAKN